MTSAVQCLSRIEWYLPGHFILLHLIITWAISGQGTRATWNELNTLESMGLRDWASGPIQKMSRTATEDVEDGTGSWEVFLTLRFYPIVSLRVKRLTTVRNIKIAGCHYVCINKLAQ